MNLSRKYQADVKLCGGLIGQAIKEAGLKAKEDVVSKSTDEQVRCLPPMSAKLILHVPHIISIPSFAPNLHFHVNSIQVMDVDVEQLLQAGMPARPARPPAPGGGMLAGVMAMLNQVAGAHNPQVGASSFACPYSVCL